MAEFTKGLRFDVMRQNAADGSCSVTPLHIDITCRSDNSAGLEKLMLFWAQLVPRAREHVCGPAHARRRTNGVVSLVSKFCLEAYACSLAIKVVAPLTRRHGFRFVRLKVVFGVTESVLVSGPGEEAANESVQEQGQREAADAARPKRGAGLRRALARHEKHS